MLDKSKLPAEVLKIVEYREASLDKIRGCMIGGAAGDALGFPVEFSSYETIIGNYGQEGISEYKIDPSYGKARISDDTQMSLFTANGLLVGQHVRRSVVFPAAPDRMYILHIWTGSRRREVLLPMHKTFAGSQKEKNCGIVVRLVRLALTRFQAVSRVQHHEGSIIVKDVAESCVLLRLHCFITIKKMNL